MTRHPGLSKSRIIIHRQCPRRLWLQVYRPELAVVEKAATEMMATGRRVGEVARTLFPNGLLMPEGDLKQARWETDAALALRPRRPLFEATFSHQQVLVQADILYPAGNGYRMAEVKAANEVKEYHYDDAAVQAWVIRQAGVRLHRVEICHLNRDYIYPGGDNWHGLFALSDITSEVKDRRKAIPTWVSDAQRTLGQTVQPRVQTGVQCRQPFACPFFTHCEPNAIAELRPCDLQVLPRAGSLVTMLRESGFTSLKDVPPEKLNNPVQQRIRRTLIANRAEIDPVAGEILGGLPYPRYYLDFETMQFAIPFWIGTSPYAQIPFQWSCHVEKRAGGKLREHSFLADGANNPCRELTENLLAAVGKMGPIFVYSSFEQSRLKNLASQYPDLAPAIEKVMKRLVDLLPITKKYYYHPDMRGSWSLKAVLPTIAPDLDYSNLPVADGLMAQEAFQEIMRPETKVRRRNQLRRQLVEYCGLDTLALVRLVHFFMEASASCRRKSTRP
ncbi:DUF2779 domain-containing protein [Desulfurivibrio sp. C05AmB]|uniref:DUF2779 domain-containing protein n=1 Tax=Desulfurivibrio sp. C05AmB TaxID=3374371 RepID=UPI00376F3AB1